MGHITVTQPKAYAIFLLVVHLLYLFLLISLGVVWHVLLALANMFLLVSHLYWKMEVSGNDIFIRRLLLPQKILTFSCISHVKRKREGNWEFLRLYEKDKRTAFAVISARANEYRTLIWRLEDEGIETR